MASSRSKRPAPSALSRAVSPARSLASSVRFPSSPKPAIEPPSPHRSNCCPPGAPVAPGWFGRGARRMERFACETPATSPRATAAPASVRRDQHLFARVGRRTFALFCRALPGQAACDLADEIRPAISGTPFQHWRPCFFDISISAGVSWLPFPGVQSEQELLRMADVAVHDAKVTHDSVVPVKMKPVK